MRSFEKAEWDVADECADSVCGRLLVVSVVGVGDDAGPL